MMTFTSLAKHRKSFRPSLTAAYTSQLLYTCVAHVKTAGSMARARPYSRKITHYASIMPSAAKHVLFPLLCRHNLRKPTYTPHPSAHTCTCTHTHTSMHMHRPNYSNPHCTCAPRVSKDIIILSTVPCTCGIIRGCWFGSAGIQLSSQSG